MAADFLDTGQKPLRWTIANPIAAMVVTPAKPYFDSAACEHECDTIE
jgi:hypothetical protein